MANDKNTEIALMAMQAYNEAHENKVHIADAGKTTKEFILYENRTGQQALVWIYDTTTIDDIVTELTQTLE